MSTRGHRIATLYLPASLELVGTVAAALDAALDELGLTARVVLEVDRLDVLVDEHLAGAGHRAGLADGLVDVPPLEPAPLVPTALDPGPLE